MDIQDVVLSNSFCLTTKGIPFNLINSNYKDVYNIREGIDFRHKHGLYIIHDIFLDIVWYVGIAAESDIRDRNIRHRRRACGSVNGSVEAWDVASTWMQKNGYDYISNVSIMIIDTEASKSDLKQAESQLIERLNPLINDQTFNYNRFHKLNYKFLECA